MRRFKNSDPVKVCGIPAFDGKNIIDVSSELKWRGNYEKAREMLERVDAGIRLPEDKVSQGGEITLSRGELEEIGLALLPVTALGILNGGSATSYADYTKNSSFNPALFNHNRELFDSISEKISDMPKGITPAYINRDYSDGYSFSELKMRSILLKAEKYIKKYGGEISATFCSR
jgi:hypothetical protein